MKLITKALPFLSAALLALSAACVDNGSGDDDDIGPGDGGTDIGELGPGVSTLAGSNVPGNVDGSREVARFYNPVNVAVAPGGDIIVADFDNSLIRRVTPEGDTTTVIEPDPNFYRPFGLAFTDNNTLLVQTDYNATADRGGALWSIDLGSGAKTLVANDVGRPRGLVAIDSNRAAFIEYQQHVIQVIDLGSKNIQTIAGSMGQAGYTDGAAGAARFNVPYDAIKLPNGNLLVADQMNHRLREVTMSGQVTTWAGTGNPATIDGARMQASFNQPQGLAIDDGGNVYVAERGGYVVRKIDASGNVSTIAGNGQPASIDHTDPNQAAIYGLEGIDVTPDGRFVYVADGSRGEPVEHHYIRRVQMQ
jgi:DNA-binding beta-propeller fold protein YncE